MNSFSHPKPYGRVSVLGQCALHLHAGGTRQEAFAPDDFVFLLPHWYRVNQQRALQSVCDLQRLLAILAGLSFNA